jgi:hypothetical protein
MERAHKGDLDDHNLAKQSLNFEARRSNFSIKLTKNEIEKFVFYINKIQNPIKEQIQIPPHSIVARLATVFNLPFSAQRDTKKQTVPDTKMIINQA